MNLNPLTIGSLNNSRACFFHAIEIRRWRGLAIAAMAVVILLPSTGCQLFNRFRAAPERSSPVAFTQIPTKEQVISHLVDQASRVEQLQSDVKVSVAGMPALRGTLAVEKPDRLRMNAGLLGVTELGIDVGSNQEVFWFWSKVAAGTQGPAIYYARHDEYQSSMLQRVLPIEPSWLIDSLGLMQFDSQDQIEGPFQRPDGRLEFRTVRSIGGQKTTRKTVVDRKYGWVVQQSIYDAKGKLLAYANSKEHEHYPEYQISLPGLIAITAFNPDGSQMTISITASRYRINSIFGDPDKLWNMPTPGDVPQINLATLSDVNTSSPPVSAGASNIRQITSPQQQGIANRSVIQHLR